MINYIYREKYFSKDQNLNIFLHKYKIGCPEVCKICNDGKGMDGKPLSSKGICEYHCSNDDECGNGDDYKNGVDCTGCKYSK